MMKKLEHLKQHMTALRWNAANMQIEQLLQQGIRPTKYIFEIPTRSAKFRRNQNTKTWTIGKNAL